MVLQAMTPDKLLHYVLVLGGIKLHAELTYLLGVAAECLMTAAGVFYSSTWVTILPVLAWFVAGMSACFGLCTGLAAISDLFVLLAWPVEVMYIAVAKMYELHLHYLLVTWKLMRGNHKVGEFTCGTHAHL